MTATFDRGIVLLLVGIVLGALLFPRCPDDTLAAVRPVPETADTPASLHVVGGNVGNVGFGGRAAAKQTG